MNILVNTLLALYILVTVLGTILGLYLIAIAIVGLMQDGENNEH